jgi:hypothetical protein
MLIAASFTKLGEMAESGVLYEEGKEGQPAVPERFHGVIEELAESHQQRRADQEDVPDDPQLWTTPGAESGPLWEMLSYMVQHGTSGSSWAATIFKNIQGRNKLIKETVGNKFKTWRDMMAERSPMEGSEGWAIWKPRPFTAWYMTNSINDKLLEQVLSGAKELAEEDVRGVLARGADVTWVIPKELADVMDGKDFQYMTPDNVAEAFMEKSLNWWKRYILINPARIFKYNLNNLSGDLDITLAYDPKILKFARQAAKDLWAFHYNKRMSRATKAEMDEAMRDGVIGSGMTVHDIPDISKTADLRRLMDAMSADKVNALKYIDKFWEGSKNFTTWRENVLRLAAYRYFKVRTYAGHRVYGASEPGKVDAVPIHQPGRKAALLARELIGDYGGLSKGGQWLRRHLIPFYSWLEINSPRYYRMMRNIQYEGMPQGRRLRVGAVMAKRAAFLSAKMAMLYAAVQLFNHLFWPDEEEELGEVGRRQLHLILGRRGDGSIMTLRFQGALSDALAFIGLHDAPDDIKDIANGKKSVYQWFAEMPYEFTNKFVQGVRPEIKVPGELITKKTVFPEFLEPRPIRDRLEHVARLFSAETIYRRVANKPIRGDSVAGRVLNDLSSLVSYTADPGEIAYHHIRRLGNEYLKENNLERPAKEPTNRMNALYYYKKALKYGDAKAAEKYLALYKKLGGNLERLRISIKNTHPLSMIPKKYRGRFLRSLTAKEKKSLKLAKSWYKKTYLTRRKRQ